MKSFNFIINVIIISLLAEPTTARPLIDLARNLTILARISNSIALQKEWSETKKLNLGELATEASHLEIDMFETIRKVNISGARWVLDMLVNETSNAQSRPTKLDSAEMEQIKNLYSFFEEAAKLFESNSPNYAMDFMTNLFNDSEVNALRPCDPIIIKNIGKFFGFTSGRITVQAEDELATIKYLTDSTEQVSLNACYGKLKNYAATLEKSNLVKAMDGIDYILNAKNIAEMLASREAEFKDPSGTIIKLLDKMDAFMTDIRQFWTNLPPPFDSKYIDRAFVFYENDIFHRKLKTLPPNRTLAFPNPPIMNLLGADLNATWFIENIVRGKMKEKNSLKRALEPMLKVAQQMENLYKTYGNSSDFFKDNFSELSRVNRTIDEFLLFGGKNYLEIMRTLKNNVANCSSQIFPVTQQDKEFSTFEEEIENTLKFRNIFRDIKRIVKELNKVLIFSKFNETILSMKMPTMASMGEFKRYYQSQETFQKWGEIFERLWKAQSDFEGALEPYKKPSTNAIKQAGYISPAYIGSSNCKGYFKCIKQNVDFKSLREILKFLDSVVHFPRNYTEPVREFLKQMESVQVEYSALLGIEAADNNLEESLKVVKNFTNPMELTKIYAKGVQALGKMSFISDQSDLVRNSTTISQDALRVLFQKADPVLISVFLMDPAKKFQRMLDDLATLEPLAEKAAEKINNPDKMFVLKHAKKVFEAAKNVPEMAPITSKMIFDVASELKNVGRHIDAEKLEKLTILELDYAKFHNDLSDVSSHLEAFQDQFSSYFGFVTVEKKEIVEKEKLVKEKEFVEKDPSASSYILVVLCVVAFFLFGFCALFIGYGCTKSGKSRYYNWFLYYFPNQKEFEKRWRYALFMDTVNNENVVSECTREVNAITLKTVLRDGAYINVYNRYGNTALHLAIRMGMPKVLEELITHGADRTLLNHQNRTPEQMFPKDLSKFRPLDQKNYERCREIYEKHRNKKYRIRVPREFPVSLFHVFIEERPEPKLCDDFMDEFKSICTEEQQVTTTHCVVQVNKEGQLETDEFEILVWIFRGVIIVKEQWMRDCLENEKNLEKDYEYLVKAVKYHGVVYENAILPWSRAMAKREMPYLHGVRMVVVMADCPYFASLNEIVLKLGGEILREMPEENIANPGSHPYLHANKPPFWIIHDGNFEIAAYEKDPERRFYILTMEQFIAMLLRREVVRNTDPNPIPVTNSEEYT